MTTPSNSSRQQRAVVAARSPRVRDQAGADARPRARPRLPRPSARRARAREQPVDQPVAVDPELGGELGLELLLRQLARLERDQQARGISRSSRKRRRTASGSRPASLAERPERGEQVGRHHAAPVDEQAAAWPRCRRSQNPCCETCTRAARELEHALAERLQVRVVGRAGDRALVVALHEHDRLPQRERHVPVERLHRAARALLVALDQLLAAGEAVQRGDAVEVEAADRRRRAGSSGSSCSRRRRAGRRSSPSPSRGSPSAGPGAGGEHRVAEPVVAVDDRGRRRLGHVCRAASARPPRPRELARAVVLPQPDEAPQLALQIAGRLAEALQPDRRPVDRVQLDERVDQLIGDPRRARSGVSSGSGIESVITSPWTSSIT